MPIVISMCVITILVCGAAIVELHDVFQYAVSALSKLLELQ
jgi:hypothetical protein